MRSVWTAFGTAFLALTMAGCAAVAPPQGGDLRPLQAQISEIREMQQNLDLQLQSTREEIQEVRDRIGEQEMVVAELREKLVAQKVTAVGEKTEEIPATRTPSGTLPPTTGADSAPGSPTEIYLQAFADYASGRYQRAILGFEAFMQYFPGNYYADNAQYWLGECYFAQQQYGRAVEEFRKLVENYPQGSKVPEALYKTAVSLKELNRMGEAEETLELLRRRYPDSAAARKSLQGD